MEITGKTEIDKPEIQTQQIISDIDIMSTEYQPPCWIVPGLLPEGLTVLAGKPKIGKSMLSLNLSVSISTGGIARDGAKMVHAVANAEVPNIHFHHWVHYTENRWSPPPRRPGQPRRQGLLTN